MIINVPVYACFEGYDQRVPERRKFMGKKHLISAMAAAAAAVCVCTASAYAADDNTVNITIDPAGEKKTISPYIYGFNE